MGKAKKVSEETSQKTNEIVIKETEDDVVFEKEFSPAELKDEIKKEAEKGAAFSKYFLPILVFSLILGLSFVLTWYYAKPERTEEIRTEDKIQTPPKVENQTTQPVQNPAPIPAPAQQAESYTIKEGDTLSSIANSFGLTSKQVADYNGITDVNSLHIGQVIKIPK